MTTIKLKFRPSAVTGKKGTLYYQVICQRKVAVLSTDYHIYPNEWNARCGIVNITDKGDERAAELLLYRSKTKWEMCCMRNIVMQRENTGSKYSIDELMNDIRHISPCMSLFGYIRLQIERKKLMRCYGTAKTYGNALRSFRNFRGGKDVCFADMTVDMMLGYEAWMLRSGLKRSSASCYIRTLRTLYRMAVGDGLAEERGIFKQVHVSVGKTRKRAVSAEAIRAIMMLDLTDRPSLSFARDIFMFSFYTRGMSFVDMAHLKKSDLRNGLITYNRCKTFQSLTIQWESPMQAIIDKYAEQTKDTPYMLPIITADGTNTDRIVYDRVLQRINRNLKRIGILVGLSVPLTTYVARHSWASIARNMDVPLSVISEGLGHDSDKTTQVYLASLDTAMINKANKNIINKIIGQKRV